MARVEETKGLLFCEIKGVTKHFVVAVCFVLFKKASFKISNSITKMCTNTAHIVHINACLWAGIYAQAYTKKHAHSKAHIHIHIRAHISFFVCVFCFVCFFWFLFFFAS